MHFTIFVRHIRRFWPVFNKKSWPIMRPSALQRWLRWFISAMPTMHCTHVVQVKTCGWGWTTWLPSIWLRSDSSLMQYLFRRILATSYCTPSSRRWNIFRIKEHSQHYIDRSSAPIKVCFILERMKKASKMQHVSSNIWHQGRQKMNLHNKNRLPCKTPLQLEYYNTYSLRLGLSKKRGGVVIL